MTRSRRHSKTRVPEPSLARVLLVSVVYEPDMVSTAGIVAGLARGLRDLGHEVSVLTSVPHYNPQAGPAGASYRTGFLKPYTYAEEDGVHVVRCFSPQKSGRTAARLWGFAVFHATAALAALRFFRRSQVTIVVSPPLTLALLAFLLRVLGNTKVIYNAQELWPDVPRDLGVITNPLLLRVLGAVERAIYRRSDAVTPIGERFALAIRQRGAAPEKVVVIPNFVDTAWIAPRPKLNPLSVQWGVATRPVALYAGNIGLTQDFDLVLSTAERMAHIEFVLVGAGAGSTALARLHGERRLANVQIHPYVDKSRVADLYGLADIVMVPLRVGHDRTTTPSKIFSAMAAGKPVLACAARDTDLADELAASVAGVSVPPGDVDAFAQGLEALLDESRGRQQWDRESALASAARHSAAEVASAYAALIDQLLRPDPAAMERR